MRSNRAWGVSLGVLMVLLLALALSLRLPGAPDWCVRAVGLGTLAALGVFSFLTMKRCNTNGKRELNFWALRSFKN